MVNVNRMNRIKVFIYSMIVILLLTPLILAIICIRMLFAMGQMESTLQTVAGRVEDAAVSIGHAVSPSMQPSEYQDGAVSKNSAGSNAVVPSQAQASSLESASGTALDIDLPSNSLASVDPGSPSSMDSAPKPAKTDAQSSQENASGSSSRPANPNSPAPTDPGSSSSLDSASQPAKTDAQSSQENASGSSSRPEFNYYPPVTGR